MGRPLIRIRPPEKSVFFLGQVTHYNEIISEKSLYFSPGQVSHYNETIQKKIFVFFHIFIFYLDRSSITMRLFLKNFCIFFKKISTFFTNQVSRLEQLDYLQKIFTILLHGVGCLEQLDHFSKKNQKKRKGRAFTFIFFTNLLYKAKRK